MAARSSSDFASWRPGHVEARGEKQAAACWASGTLCWSRSAPLEPMQLGLPTSVPPSCPPAPPPPPPVPGLPWPGQFVRRPRPCKQCLSEDGKRSAAPVARRAAASPRRIRRHAGLILALRHLSPAWHSRPPGQGRPKSLLRTERAQWRPRPAHRRPGTRGRTAGASWDRLGQLPWLKGCHSLWARSQPLCGSSPAPGRIAQKPQAMQQS